MSAKELAKISQKQGLWRCVISGRGRCGAGDRDYAHLKISVHLQDLADDLSLKVVDGARLQRRKADSLRRDAAGDCRD